MTDRKHSPEQTVRTARQGRRLLEGGKDPAEVAKALQITEAGFIDGRTSTGH